MACPTNPVPTPPPPTSSAARRISSPPLPSSALLHPLLLRPFPRPIYRVQRSAQYPAGNRKIRIGISHLGLFLPSPLSCFRQEFVDKTMPASVSPPAIHGPSPSRSGWLRSVQFANFVLSTGCTDIDRTRHCRRGKTRK